VIGKVFKAYDVRATYPRPLNEKIAWQVGHGAATHLLAEAKAAGRLDPMARAVVVGRDMRTSSPSLSASLIDGIRDAGARVIDIGMVDTPAVYFAINRYDTAGGIQVTASHNPATYNGFKISGIEARPIGTGTGLDEIKRLAAMADKARTPSIDSAIESRDPWSDYREFMRERLDERIRSGKRRLRIAIDASNGMAGAMVPALFGDVAGLDIIPINFDMPGTFVHEPNPLVEANLAQVREAVIAEKADFGVCFDGDADRCMIVDEKGGSVGCDLLLAWMVGPVLAAHRGASIVYDLRSSRAVREAIEKAGGTPVESRVGHVFMKKALRESGAPIGGELSGHFYFADHFGTDSGARAFVEVCNLLAGGGTVSKAIAPHDRYARSGEINFEVESVEDALAEVDAAFGKHESSRLDGVSHDLGDWWSNVRPSNTEPLLRLNVEAGDRATMEAAIAGFVEMFGEPVEH
jgi:phosphomannomutase